jgi:hypothetical protein
MQTRANLTGSDSGDGGGATQNLYDRAGAAVSGDAGGRTARDVAAPVRRYSREITRGCGYDVRVIGQLAGTGRSGLQR